MYLLAEDMASIDDMYRLLDDLTSKEFKRFKEYLRRRTLPGFEPIPLSLLEKADVTDTVRLMTQRYGNNRCMEMTQHILNTMGHKNSTQEQLGQTSENSSIGSTNQTVRWELCWISGLSECDAGVPQLGCKVLHQDRHSIVILKFDCHVLASILVNTGTRQWICSGFQEN